MKKQNRPKLKNLKTMLLSLAATLALSIFITQTASAQNNLNTEVLNNTDRESTNGQETQIQITQQDREIFNLPRIKNTVIIDEEEIVEGNLFTSGETVEIFGTVNGDVYTAGGNIHIEGEINGDVLAAGGNVRITGDIDQDLRVFGGNVTILGDIGGNLSALSGNLTIEEAAQIDGSLAIASGNTYLYAPVSDEVSLMGANFYIGDIVDGNVKSIVEQIRLGPDANINDNLFVISDSDLSVDENKVTGEVVLKKRADFGPDKKDIKAGKQSLKATLKKGFQGLWLTMKTSKLIALLVIGFILIKFYPEYYTNFNRTLSGKPLASLGVGFATTVLTPFVFTLLFVTVLGLPLGLILMSIYFIAMYLAPIPVIAWVGKFASKKLDLDTSEVWIYVVGTVVYTILILIPFLSFIINSAFLLLGLGTYVLSCKKMLKSK